MTTSNNWSIEPSVRAVPEYAGSTQYVMRREWCVVRTTNGRTQFHEVNGRIVRASRNRARAIAASMNQ